MNTVMKISPQGPIRIPKNILKMLKIWTYVDDVSITPNPKKGDIDANGTIDLSDAILGLWIISGMTPPTAPVLTADVNADGRIGMEEVVYILETVAG